MTAGKMPVEVAVTIVWKEQPTGIATIPTEWQNAGTDDLNTLLTEKSYNWSYTCEVEYSSYYSKLVGKIKITENAQDTT